MTMSVQPPVRVVGAIDDAYVIDEGAVRAAWAHPRPSGRGSTFPGRLSTQVFADTDIVLKVRGELQLPAADPARWVRGRLERERLAGVYPADRTWVLIGDGDAVRAGTASRRRRPLHLWARTELDAWWDWYCEQFCAIYLTGADAGWRLDEGSSNFSRDGHPGGLPRIEGGIGIERMVYLDDDLYVWDDGIGLGTHWAVFARQYPWLSAEQGELLGASMRAAADRHRARLDLAAVARDIARRDTAHQPTASAGAGRGGGFLTGLVAALTAPRRTAAAAAPTDGVTILLADIHGNSVALDAVLADPEVVAADELLVLGDIVGYGPDPAGCLARLRADPRVRALKGNHDQGCLDPTAAGGFNPDAGWALSWTRDQLGAEDRAWLGALPLELSGPGWLAVHGAPIDPARFLGYVYQMTAEDNLRQVELDKLRFCFHGHTHVAGSWIRQAAHHHVEFLPPWQAVELDGHPNALVCPGSVGQPRDGDPRASFAVLNRTTNRLRFRRVAYDIAATQDRMRSLGFPEKLITRLAAGR